MKRGVVLVSPVSGKAYRLENELGHGGFGVAFRARQITRQGQITGRPVCLKIAADQASWHREAYFGELLAHNRRAIRVHESFPCVGRFEGKERAAYCLVTELARYGALGIRLIGQCKAEGIAFLLTDQNARKALEVAHYGYVLSGGKVVLEGPTASLRANAAVGHACLRAQPPPTV